MKNTLGNIEALVKLLGFLWNMGWGHSLLNVYVCPHPMPASFLALWGTIKLGTKGETSWILQSCTARWQAPAWWSFTRHEERAAFLQVLHLLGLVPLLASLAVILLPGVRTQSSQITLIPHTL